MFSRKRNLHVCEDCAHEFAVETPFVPQRIFLSYGHDHNEELVRRIKADLENAATMFGSTKARSRVGESRRGTIGGERSPTAF